MDAPHVDISPIAQLRRTFEWPACWQDNARMGVLMAPFRPRDVNPLNYDSKMSFWRDLIITYLQHKGGATFSMQELCFMFKRNELLPHCLDTVLEQLKQAKQVLPLEEFKRYELQTWGAWLLSSFVKQPLSWGWRRLKNATGIGVVPAEYVEYVHLDILKNLCRVMQNKVLEALEGTVMHYDEFKSQCIASMHITEDCLKLCLNVLHCEQKIGMEYVTKAQDSAIHLIKIPSKTNPSIIITALDRAVHNLNVTQKCLNKQLDELDESMEASKQKAKALMAEGKRQLAKNALRRMHNMRQNYEKRALALHNIEELLDTVNNSQNTGGILDAYKIGSDALKQALAKSGLQYDNVDEIIADAGETMDRYREVEDAMANGNITGDSQTSASELEELERELNELCQEDKTVDEAALAPAAAAVAVSDNVNNNEEPLKLQLPEVCIEDEELLAMLDKLDMDHLNDTLNSTAPSTSQSAKQRPAMQLLNNN